MATTGKGKLHEKRTAARQAGGSQWWFGHARTGATIAACLYVIVWSALLGDFAANLTGRQQLAMAITVLLGGVLIWLAVRALLLQERMEAQHENIEAAQESRAFVRALMDNLPVAVWLKTTDHRYQAANVMWAQYNPTLPSWQHRSVDRLVGHTDRELYESQRAAEFERTDDIVIATGARWEQDYDETGADGTHMKFHVIKVPVFDIRGDVASVAGIGIDVTRLRLSQKKLELMHEQVQQYLKWSFEHVCVLGSARRIQHANLRMCEFFGAYPSELNGKDAADLVTPSDRGRFTDFVETVCRTGSSELEVVHAAHVGGDIRSLELSGVLLTATHGERSVVIVGRDVTDRRGLADSCSARSVRSRAPEGEAGSTTPAAAAAGRDAPGTV